MKVTHKVNEFVTVEADGANISELFERLAVMDEIFSIDACGVCGCKGIFYQVRENSGHKYHMAVCRNPECGAEFRFGCKLDKVTLFPQYRYPTEVPKGKQPHPQAGEWKPDNGWAVWKPTGDHDAPQSRPAPVPPRPADPRPQPQPADPRPQPQPAKVLSPADLAANLDGYDLKLSGEGLFPKGALVDAVVDACAKMGFPADPLRWAEPEAQAVARKATAVFVERARAAKK